MFLVGMKEPPQRYMLLQSWPLPGYTEAALCEPDVEPQKQYGSAWEHSTT
jgi:hypothetical protein